MHLSIRAMERAAHGEVLDRLPQLARDAGHPRPARTRHDARVLEDWRPEDAGFWQEKGRRRRHAQPLDLDPQPAARLRHLDGLVDGGGASCRSMGFDYTPNQLFWLAALPGAVRARRLRIFYSFMVPIFGGRRWTALSTASLLLPAMWIGFAVQDPANALSDDADRSPCCAAWAAATSPRAWRTFPSSSRRAEKGSAHGASTPGWATSASAPCSSWCRW
jgi:MFS transporter, NNP family, nitrate/nitrite transporter